MAYRYFGLNFGQHEFDITESSSAIGADVEVRIQISNLPVVGTNNDSIVLMEAIRNYLAGKTTQIN